VLFCCYIEIKFFKNIYFQWVQVGRHKSTCRSFFLFALSGMHYQRVQILRNALLRAYSATANALHVLHSSASVVPWMFCLMAGAYVLSEWVSEWVLVWWNYLNLLKVLIFKQQLWLAKRKTNWRVAGNIGCWPTLPLSAIRNLRPQSESFLHKTYWR
jgi:hypothetical protein